MATRARILYSSKAVKYGGNILIGVQSATYGFELARTDVNAFGKLAAWDRLLTTTPTVTTELQVLATSSQPITNKTEIMTNTAAASRDCTVNLDAATDSNSDYTSAGASMTMKGNFVSAATAEASVGAFALITLGLEGTGIDTNNLAMVAPGTAYASPQEKVEVLGGSTITSYSTNGIAQSCNMTANITREVLEKFKRKFSDQRLIQFPASASMTIEGLDLGNKANFTLATSYSEAATCLKTAPAFKIDGKKYGLIGAIPDSVTFNGGIGDNHTVSLVMSTSIGALTDTVHNFEWHA